VAESLDHLRPWMPWAHQEPESLQAKVNRLRGFRAEFDLGKNFVYAIFDPDESQVIGGTGLHPRVGPDALEIGYWIHANEVGKGYATEAAGALTRVAFEVGGMRRVEIHCDPTNERSAAVPRKLGFTHEATLKRRSLTADGEERDTMIWSLLRDDYRAQPVAQAPIEAFDALGDRVL
jgi:RimJ/RimL family protein N-acetyltransferase